jgi:hypothetical protein
MTWQHWAIGLLEFAVAFGLTDWLLGTPVDVHFRTHQRSDKPPVSPLFTQRRESYTELAALGILTPNEARRMHL